MTVIRETLTQALDHEARGERRALLSRVAQLEADVEYWRGMAARRFVS